MFERFTERARQVVTLAQTEARNRADNYIGCEHLLLGILREEEGVAARVLASLDVTLDDTHAAVTEREPKGQPVPPRPDGPVPFTPKAKVTLESALREALSLGHNYIGTEHVLLGLVRQENKAVEILRDVFQVTPEKVRDEVIRMLSGPNTRKSQSRRVQVEAVKYSTQDNPPTKDRLLEMLIEAVELGRLQRNRPAQNVAKAVIALYE